MYCCSQQGGVIYVQVIFNLLKTGETLHRDPDHSEKSVEGEWEYHHKMLRPDWVFDRLIAMIPLGEVYHLTGGRDVWDLIAYIDSFKEPNV